MATSPRNKSSVSKKDNKSAKNPSIPELLQSNNMEIVVACLLLTGILRVENVQFYRSSRMSVNLSGSYGDFNNDSSKDDKIDDKGRLDG